MVSVSNISVTESAEYRCRCNGTTSRRRISRGVDTFRMCTRLSAWHEIKILFLKMAIHRRAKTSRLNIDYFLLLLQSSGDKFTLSLHSKLPFWLKTVINMLFQRIFRNQNVLNKTESKKHVIKAHIFLASILRISFLISNKFYLYHFRQIKIELLQ